jgi:hypothetical protein
LTPHSFVAKFELGERRIDATECIQLRLSGWAWASFVGSRSDLLSLATSELNGSVACSAWLARYAGVSAFTD